MNQYSEQGLRFPASPKAPPVRPQSALSASNAQAPQRQRPQSATSAYSQQPFVLPQQAHPSLASATKRPSINAHPQEILTAYENLINAERAKRGTACSVDKYESMADEIQALRKERKKLQDDLRMQTTQSRRLEEKVNSLDKELQMVARQPFITQPLKQSESQPSPQFVLALKKKIRELMETNQQLNDEIARIRESSRVRRIAELEKAFKVYYEKFQQQKQQNQDIILQLQDFQQQNEFLKQRLSYQEQHIEHLAVNHQLQNEADEIMQYQKAEEFEEDAEEYEIQIPVIPELPIVNRSGELSSVNLIKQAAELSKHPTPMADSWNAATAAGTAIPQKSNSGYLKSAQQASNSAKDLTALTKQNSSSNVFQRENSYKEQKFAAQLAQGRYSELSVSQPQMIIDLVGEQSQFSQKDEKDERAEISEVPKKQKKEVQFIKQRAMESSDEFYSSSSQIQHKNQLLKQDDDLSFSKEPSKMQMAEISFTDLNTTEKSVAYTQLRSKADESIDGNKSAVEVPVLQLNVLQKQGFKPQKPEPISVSGPSTDRFPLDQPEKQKTEEAVPSLTVSSSMFDRSVQDTSANNANTRDDVPSLIVSSQMFTDQRQEEVPSIAVNSQMFDDKKRQDVPSLMVNSQMFSEKTSQAPSLAVFSQMFSSPVRDAEEKSSSRQIKRSIQDQFDQILE